MSLYKSILSQELFCEMLVEMCNAYYFILKKYCFLWLGYLYTDRTSKSTELQLLDKEESKMIERACLRKWTFRRQLQKIETHFFEENLNGFQVIYDFCSAVYFYCCDNSLCNNCHMFPCFFKSLLLVFIFVFNLLNAVFRLQQQWYLNNLNRY